MTDDLTDFLAAAVSGDLVKLREIVEHVVDREDSTIIKCQGCGEVVAFERTQDVLKGAFQGGDPVVTYAILLHMSKCPEHDVRLPLPGGYGEMQVSKNWETRFRTEYAKADMLKKTGRTYDEWFQTYVETKNPAGLE